MSGTMSGHRPAAAGAQTLRNGGTQSIGFQVWRKDFDPATETDPPTALDGARKLGFKQIEWMIKKPVGVTSYDVTYYRLGGVFKNRQGVSTEVIALFWTPDETVKETENSSYLQSVRGDELYPVITNVVGAVGTGFDIIYKGCNE